LDVLFSPGFSGLKGGHYFVRFVFVIIAFILAMGRNYGGIA
jgi:hypothetical protein